MYILSVLPRWIRETDQVMGYEAGADDYMTETVQPFRTSSENRGSFPPQKE